METWLPNRTTTTSLDTGAGYEEEDEDDRINQSICPSINQ
jgi:hypothetical protein